jgi:hypothetical protein
VAPRHSSDTSKYDIDDDAAQNETLLESEEEDYIIAAKSLFDVKEYSRAYKLLSGCQSAKAQFICLYSRYLVCSAMFLRCDPEL